MYEEWQCYEEEILKEFHEKGLSNKKINIWNLLIEYPLNEEKCAWAVIDDLKDVLQLPRLVLIPLKLEQFWDFKKFNPKEVLKLIKNEQALPIATAAPKSFGGQPEWIKEIISTTKKIFGFYPPCTQWRYDAYVSGLKGDESYYLDEYLMKEGTYGYSLLKSLDVDPNKLKRDSWEDLQCRYTLAITNNLRLLGMQEIIEKITEIINKELKSYNPIDKIIYLRELLKEPYRIFVSPLRTHLAGLCINTSKSSFITKAIINSKIFKKIGICKIHGPTVIKNISDLYNKIQNSAEYEEYRKCLYEVWKNIYESGNLERKLIDKVSELSEVYYKLCKELSQQLEIKIKNRFNVIRFAAYALQYGPLGFSILTFNPKTVAVNVLLAILLELLMKKTYKPKEPHDHVCEKIKKRHIISIPEIFILR